MDFASEALKSGSFSEILLLSSLNYSDEEMAMLCFYLLFQMEQDEQTAGEVPLRAGCLVEIHAVQ